MTFNLKKAALYFETNTSQTIYSSTDLQAVEAFQEASYSVILSLASFMSWKFPGLAPPESLEDSLNHHPPIPLPSHFPNFESILQPYYNKWVQLFCSTVEKNCVRRDGDCLVLKVTIPQSYAETQLLPLNSFYRDNGRTHWYYLHTLFTLDFPESTQKQILFISCSESHKGVKPRIYLPALFYGIYYNNQKWSSFRVFDGERPTPQQYASAHAIIVPGSSHSAYSGLPELVKFQQQLSTLLTSHPSIKYLGVCFGHQFLAHSLGGEVRKAKVGTYGLHVIQMLNTQSSNEGIQKLLPTVRQIKVNEFHGDQVVRLPAGFKTLMSSSNCQNEMIVSGDSRYLGIQCHPEYSSGFMKSYNVRYASFLKQNVKHAIKQSIVQYDENHHLRDLIKHFLSSV